jgi:hypothetical protein
MGHSFAAWEMCPFFRVIQSRTVVCLLHADWEFSVSTLVS